MTIKESVMDTTLLRAIDEAYMITSATPHYHQRVFFVVDVAFTPEDRFQAEYIDDEIKDSVGTLIEGLENNESVLRQDKGYSSMQFFRTLQLDDHDWFSRACHEDFEKFSRCTDRPFTNIERTLLLALQGLGGEVRLDQLYIAEYHWPKQSPTTGRVEVRRANEVLKDGLVLD